MSKSFIANTAVLLSKNDFSFNSNVVRLNNSRIDASKTKNHLFWRNETIAIINQHGEHVICSVMGTPSTMSITKNAIALDYDGRSYLGILGIDEAVQCELTARLALFHEILIWYHSHPDMGYLIATRLGVIGVSPGLLSIVISVAVLLV